METAPGGAVKTLLAALAITGGVSALPACFILDPEDDVQVTISDASGPHSLGFGWLVRLYNRTTLIDAPTPESRGQLAQFYADSLPFTFRKSVDRDDCSQLSLGVWGSGGIGLGSSRPLLAFLRLGACAVFDVEVEGDNWTVIRK